MSDDFDAAVASTLQPSPAQAARVGFSVAADTNPDAHAEALRVARRTGVPVDTVLAYPQEMKRQAAVGSIDFDTLAKTSPATAALLADTEKAKVAHDDVDGMRNAEDALKSWKRPAPSFASVSGGLAEALKFKPLIAGLRLAFNDAMFGTGGDAGDQVRRADLVRKAGQAQAQQDYTTPAFESSTASGVYSGGVSLLQNLPGLAASIMTGSPAPGLALAGMNSAAPAYGKYSARGASAGEAALGAGMESSIEVLTEALPMGFLVKNFGRVGFGEFMTGLLGREIPTEIIATLVQNMTDSAIANPDVTMTDYLNAQPDAVYQTVLATLVQSVAMGGAGKIVQVATGRAQAAQDAERGGEYLDKLNQAMAASKVLQRDPETFEQFVASAAEGTPVQAVFIDANTLMQSDVADQVIAASPAVASQIQQAMQTGGQIAIPIDEYAAKIATTDAAGALLEHLKTDPEGFSRAEAQQYMQSHAEDLRAEVERAMEDQQGHDAFRESADVVRAEIRTQLDAAGRFTGPANDAYASLVGNFFAVQAAKMGITPQELYARYPLNVTAQAVGGAQFDQGVSYKTFRGVSPDGANDFGVAGKGEYSAGRRQTAEMYAGRDGRVEEREVTLNNPLSATYAELMDLQTQLYGRPLTGFEPDLSQQFDEWLRARGHDGVVLFDPEMSTTVPEEVVKLADLPTQRLEQGPRGAFSPASNTITLLKAADLSTFLHETGHFFLEAQLDMAARLAAVEERTEGENEIIRDANALLTWFGLRDIHEWNALDFEEKRDYHERFARGFEAYLFEGKAPSIELQGVFQRFRAWLVNIYRDLKALNVELTDEVRGVMDRMIATGEQIQLAERGRSMMPLFRTAEQAGMTPEEFAAYQALGTQSTADAVEDLQARGLRDLQWLHNARGREIARLQKQGETQRANLRMEVRREVMSQPVYRAWQFLTGKISEGDKLAPPERVKPDPDIVDPGIDSLFAAIAKLGGINRESAAGLWGVKPEDKPASGLFGKPVLRAEGKGATVDQMAEKLAELGYLEHDENGNTALRDFEDAFRVELGGSPVYSSQADYDALSANDVRPGDQVIAGNLLAGRLDRAGLADIAAPAEAVAAVEARRMTAKTGLHPDIVAELFGFSSGDELVRALAEATPPKEEIDALTDQRMMEQFGELATPEAIARSADKAIHNDARARMIATEINALAKATGQRKVLASAAREYAAAMIARLRVRDIRPGQYASAEARAARAAQKASQSGELATAAAEKRNELVNNYAARAAYDAQEEVAAGVRYLKKFDSTAVRKALTADYADQIDALLERFDLRTGQSLKTIDKRAALADWIKSQQDAGIEPDIPPELLDGAFRKSFKDMTVEEFRGLLDAVKQIEHLGRLKQYLLTAKGRREYEAARNEIVASIELHADGRTADTRTPTTSMGRALQGLKRFGAAHIKAATWARIMDGGKDGGPMWEYFVRAANERGDMETTMRAGATKALSEIMAPVFAQPGPMGGKGKFFPSINRSLNREARIALALNVGNEGNLQRLLGGEGWTVAQVMPVLQSLTPQELVAVQQVWDHFESYRPQIAAKERRIYGKEPAWVAPGSAVTAQLGLRGGYYPIKYDPAASQRAEEHADAEGAKRQLQGAYTSATTRRSFTKSRVEEVSGRPLLYTLTGLYSGVNDVIHDLAWHEWLIDTNRLLKSKSIDAAIRNHYGPEVKGQLKTWAADIAEGEKGTADAVEAMLGYVRQSVSVAGLGFNVVSAAMQPLGITQSIVRVGPQWVGRGIAKYIAHPISLTREVNQMSSFMENRARTRSRELNELRNQVQDQSAVKEWVGRYAYFLMMRFQQAVDVPTWWGAYEKAIAEGNDEERAVSLADQGVIDSQGGGLLKDQSGVERASAGGKLFTVFYSFMNTALNLGVQQGMTEKSAAKQAANYALLYLIPPLLGMALKAAITPGDSGDDDPEKLARKLLAAEIDYLMGLFVGLRELSDAAKTLAGANDMGRDYQGPAGLRLFADIGKFAMQAHQGDLDDAFRKAFINLMGDLFGLPAAQINRTITGTKALAEGETENPAAVVFGFQKPR